MILPWPACKAYILGQNIMAGSCKNNVLKPLCSQMRIKSTFVVYKPIRVVRIEEMNISVLSKTISMARGEIFLLIWYTYQLVHTKEYMHSQHD